MLLNDFIRPGYAQIAPVTRAELILASALAADIVDVDEGFKSEILSWIVRVYLKKEEATARADFSSVQGGKPKV